MQMIVERLDCSKFAAGEQPVSAIKREVPGDHPFSNSVPSPRGRWFVPGPIYLDQKRPVVWSTSISSSLVRVPLYSYSTSDTSGETLFGLGVQLGATALRQAPEDKIDKLFLVLGNVWRQELAGSENYQVWLGLALRADG